MSHTIKVSTSFGGFQKTLGRVAGGGSLMNVTYTNDSDEEHGYISMTPDYPGVIFPIDMKACPSGQIVCMRDSYLCSMIGMDGSKTDVGVGFNPSSTMIGRCCAGMDLVAQVLSGGDTAFLMGMGTIISKYLSEGETLLVDTDSILCFEKSVDISVQYTGGLFAICCSGQGLFNTSLTGPGKIWLQSLSIDKMRTLFQPKIITPENIEKGLEVITDSNVMS